MNKLTQNKKNTLSNKSTGKADFSAANPIKVPVVPAAVLALTKPKRTLMHILCAWQMTLSALFVACPGVGSASPNYYSPSIDHHRHNREGEIEAQEQSERIEAYLQRNVPGLSASFKEVIDALIAEGHHVYLTGGVVRDLLSLNCIQPNDVDLDYLGTVEELIAILEKKQWRYTRLPEQNLVIIGDHRAGSIDAMPIKEGKGANEYTLEFTINNIFYHCNTRAFTPGSLIGLTDLQNERLNIVAADWEQWLYQPQGHRYYKIFRFWKMVGKGYVYSLKLARFIQEETEKSLLADPEGFHGEMLNFMSKHMSSFDELNRGCMAIMGYEWALDNCAVLKDDAQKLQDVFEAKKDRHTRFSKRK